MPLLALIKRQKRTFQTIKPKNMIMSTPTHCIGNIDEKKEKLCTFCAYCAFFLKNSDVFHCFLLNLQPAKTTSR